MAKVKKSAGLTSERNVKPAAARTRSGATARTTQTRAASRDATPRRRVAAPQRRPPADKPAPVVKFAVKELDPQRKCGLGTSVQFLYRVDESVDGRSTPHLVFFDRHGWYCEHGRACPAVTHARRYNGQMARVS